MRTTASQERSLKRSHDAGRPPGGVSGRDVLALSVPSPMLPTAPLVIALVGLALEARIAAGPDVLVVCYEEGRETLDSIETAIRSGCRSIISFGIAGALAPGLRPGDLLVASAVIDRQTIRPTDAAWSDRLLKMIPGSSYVPILGVDAPIVDPGSKRELHRTVGAAAVDMESHVVARLAQDHRLAFAALRVVIDPAHRPIPDAAVAGIGRARTPDVPTVLRELMAKPSQTIALARLGLDLLIARSSLLHVRQLLDARFHHLDSN